MSRYERGFNIAPDHRVVAVDENEYANLKNAVEALRNAMLGEPIDDSKNRDNNGIIRNYCVTNYAIQELLRAYRITEKIGNLQHFNTTCTWVWFEDGTYVSQCDHEFYATEDDDLNWMNFCPYCGKEVCVQGLVEDTE